MKKLTELEGNQGSTVSLSDLVNPDPSNDSSLEKNRQINQDLRKSKLEVTLSNQGIQSKLNSELHQNNDSNLNLFKNQFNKILEDGYNLAYARNDGNLPKVQNNDPMQLGKATEETNASVEPESDDSKLDSHRVFMGNLSEVIFPICVTDYFVTNQATNDDILRALQTIVVTNEDNFVFYNNDINLSSSIFLPKDDEFRKLLIAKRSEKWQEVEPSEDKNTVVVHSSNEESDNFFKEIGIEPQISDISNKVLKHFLETKGEDISSKSTLEGVEETENYKIVYLAHFFNANKTDAKSGISLSTAKEWYIPRSVGIVKDIDKRKVDFVDKKLIKMGRGGFSVAIRFIIIEHNDTSQGTIKENIEHKPVVFDFSKSEDNLTISLKINYKKHFLKDLSTIISNPQHEKYQEVINMIESYIDDIQDVPEIVEAREYLEYLAHNGEIDYIDVVISTTGEAGATKGELSGNIKKDADIKIIEFNAMNRVGVKDTKRYSFSLKASNRKDVGTLQFNEEGKANLEWIFDLCELNFKKLNWDVLMKRGDSIGIMTNMQNYFVSIEKSQNEKLVKFMFSMLDLYAHGHEDSTLISISQSSKDMRIYSTLISEYIRSRKIYVSVLDLNNPENVKTYYDRILKRTGSSKIGRKPGKSKKQFLLQLTDDSNDSFGIFRFKEVESRRSGAMNEAGRPAEKIVFNPFLISIDDELDELCKKLSNDLKDEKRRKILSINRIARRTMLIDKLIERNIKSTQLLNQYKEVLENFKSILIFYRKVPFFSIEEIDYKLIEKIKTEKSFNLTEYYTDEYLFLKEFILESKPISNENEEKLSLFYGTVIVYIFQKCDKLLKQIQDVSYQSQNQSP